MNSDSDPEYDIEDSDEIRRILECDDYYEILGVDQNADEDQIKKRHKVLALRFHTDKCKSLGSGEAIKLINVARDHLIDPQKRTDYDLKRNIKLSNENVNQNEDFFDSDYEKEQNEEQESYHKNNPIFEEQGIWSQMIGGINNKYIIFLTIVCLIVMPFIAWMSVSSEAAYSLHKTPKHSNLLKTRNLGVHYYVSKWFWSKYDSKQIIRFESEIEDYVNRLKASCVRERNDYRKGIESNPKSSVENSGIRILPECGILEKLPVY
jgi:curved DNA-binding protein CbpA